MLYVIVCEGHVNIDAGIRNKNVKVPIGHYLQYFDPNARDGYGLAIWTSNLTKAMVFVTHAEAAELWRTISTVRPTRPDGKPNRPLTAYHVSITPVVGNAN